MNDFDDEEYLGNITIGTPEQEFRVTIAFCNLTIERRIVCTSRWFLTLVRRTYGFQTCPADVVVAAVETAIHLSARFKVMTKALHVFISRHTQLLPEKSQKPSRFTK